MARSEERDRELSGLRARTECLEAEATCLRSGREEARKDAKCLHGERTRLQQDLREVTSRAEETESTLRAANVRLGEANMDLQREREVARGRSSSSWVFLLGSVVIYDRSMISPQILNEFSEVHDAMKATDKAWKAPEDEVRKLSIACDGAIVARVQVQASLQERSAKLQVQASLQE